MYPRVCLPQSETHAGSVTNTWGRKTCKGDSSPQNTLACYLLMFVGPQKKSRFHPQYLLGEIETARWYFDAQQSHRSECLYAALNWRRSTAEKLREKDKWDSNRRRRTAVTYLTWDRHVSEGPKDMGCLWHVYCYAGKGGLRHTVKGNRIACWFGSWCTMEWIEFADSSSDIKSATPMMNHRSLHFIVLLST